MERLNDILPYIEKRQCAIFVGAGISKIAGCYDWDSIIKEMFAHPTIQGKGIRKEDLTRQFSNEELISYCYQLFAESATERDYWGIARKAILFDVKLFQNKYLPVIKLLKKITPLPPIITTNIDDCLEHTKEFDLSKLFFRLGDFNEASLSSGGIFHIHGYRDDFSESLLQKEKYIERYYNPDFQKFMTKVFSQYSVLFMGYSLRDKEIANIMLKTKDIKTKHFMLVPIEDNLSDADRSVLFQMYGIRTITYGPLAHFDDFLGQWISKNFEPTSIGMEDGSRPIV